MDIRQLDYFIVVARLGNFTKAADELFISRQALSKAVRNLEHELKETLLVTRDNHLELTDKGKALRDEAAPIVQAYKELEQRHAAAYGAAPSKQSLTVAAVHGAAISLPDRALDTFRAEHPDILLSVEEASTDAAIDMARSGESDISLVGSAPTYLEEFDIALVIETGVHAFVPQGSALQGRPRLSIEDFDGQPFVTFGKRDHLHRYFVEACEDAGVRPDIILTSSNKELLVRTAIEQRAFYFGFPSSVHTPDRETDEPIPVDLGRDDAFGTYAIKRRGVPLSSAARAFWEYLLRL